MENIIVDQRHKRILELIKPNKNQEILIIGTGYYPKMEHILFYEYGCKKITSGDIAKKNTLNGKKVLPQLNFVYLDAQKRLPFKDNTFDRVVLTEVLEHLPNERIALAEIKRVLKKDGSLAMTVPRRRLFGIFSPVTLISHEREYNKETISKVLIKNGYRVEQISTGGSFYDLVNLWVHLIYKWVFKKTHLNNEEFLKKKIDKSFEHGFKGKGTDLFVEAKKAEFTNKNK